MATRIPVLRTLRPKSLEQLVDRKHEEHRGKTHPHSGQRRSAASWFCWVVVGVASKGKGRSVAMGHFVPFVHQRALAARAKPNEPTTECGQKRSGDLYQLPPRCTLTGLCTSGVALSRIAQPLEPNRLNLLNWLWRDPKLMRIQVIVYTSDVGVAAVSFVCL